MSIQQEDILNATTGGLDIILNLYPDAAESVSKPNRKFKTREEKTASAKLNRHDNGTYLVYDFGHDEKSRNGILCYMLEQNCDYPTAINELAIRYNVSGSSPETTTIKAEYSERAAKDDEHEGKWSWDLRDALTEVDIETVISKNIRVSLGWKSDDEKKHARALEQIETIFKKYNVWSVKSYSLVKNRMVKIFSSTDNYPIFLIDEGVDTETRFQKIYQPLHFDKGKRFMYVPGKKPANFIHGLTQLNKAYDENRQLIENESENEDKKRKDDDYKLDEIMLCTGISDALNVALCSYMVIWLNSETEQLKPFQYERIATKVKKFYVLGDIDDTGKRERHKLCMEYLDIFDIQLPESLKQHKDKRGNPCKDVRDYFNYFKKKDFKLLVEHSAMPYRFWEKKATFNRSGEFTGYDYKFKNEYAYNFIQKSGFYRLPVGDKETDFEYIQIVGNQVKLTSPVRIKAFIKDFLRSRHMDIDLRDEMHRTTQLNDSSLTSLDEVEIEFIDNDKTTQYIFFLNKTLEITASGIKEYNPGTVRRFVWEDEIHDHRWQMPKEPPFVITKSDLGEYDIEIKNTDCLFLKYLIQTSRVHWRVEHESGREKEKKMTPAEFEDYKIENQFNIAGPLLTDDEIAEQKQHLINKLFSIGYLMHRYKDRSKPWFIFAMDAKINEDGQSHGGSGKSILYDVAMKTLLKKFFMLNGRNPKLTEDPHKYDGLTEHYRYLFIDDAHEWLKLDVFYPDITGDMKVNPKGKTPYTIPFEKSPKASFSSNYTPRNLGPSTERRMIYSVFSDYYHNKGETTDYHESRDPSMEFGKQMFKEFNQQEWNSFYVTAVNALVFYFNTTEKISPAMGNVNRRNLMSLMGQNFYDWAKVYFSEEGSNLDKFFPREEAFKDYMFNYKPKNFTPQAFKTKLAAFCKIEGYILNPKKFLGPKGNIIQKVEKRNYDEKTNTWYVVPGVKDPKEVFYIQAIHDLPDGIGDSVDIKPEELVKIRQNEIDFKSGNNTGQGSDYPI